MRRIRLTVVITAVLLTIVSAGCRGSGPPGGQENGISPDPPTGTPDRTPLISFGPLQPVPLPADAAGQLLTLVAGLPDLGSAACEDTGLSTVITFPPGHPVSGVRICDTGLIADGRLRGTGEAAATAASLVEPVLFSPDQVAELIRLSPRVRVTARDLPGRSAPAGPSVTAAIARALTGAVRADPEGIILPYLYPDYRIEFTVAEHQASVGWCQDGMRVEIGGCLYPRGRYHDTGGALLAVVRDLLPSPEPGELQGPARLVGAVRVRAVVDGQEIVQEEAWRTLVLVRILLRCEPGGTPPDDEEPVVMTFSGPDGEHTLRVYPDGYEFEGAHYTCPGLQRTLLTTMHSG